MAIGTPTTPILMVGGASATSFNTGDYTPPTNCVLIAFVGARGASAEEPTISDTGGIWTEITGSFADGGGFVGKLWEMTIGGSAPTLNTTAGSVGATQTAITVTDFPGGEVNQASIKTGTSSTGDPSVTMDAFGAGSAGYGCAGVSGGGANQPPTGYTELNDSLPATNVRMHVWYDLTDPATAIGTSGGGVSAYAAGLEIVEAGAGSVDDLLADDVSAGTPTVGTPAIGQVHALGANDVATAAPSVGSPALGQVHALAANDVATGAPSVGAPVLAEVDALLADDVSAGVPTVGSPTLGQVHVLTANDVTVGIPSVGAPRLNASNDNAAWVNMARRRGIR